MDKIMLIQKLLFPDEDVCNEKEMYFRGDCEYNSIEEKIYLKKDKELLLNTYFNSFSIGKWKRYTNINDLTFCFYSDKKCDVALYHSVADGDENCMQQEFNKNVFKLDIDKIPEKLLKFIDLKKEKILPEITLEEQGDFFYHAVKLSTLFDSGIVYLSVKSSENAYIFDAGWYSDISEDILNPVKIAIGICTFKREACVTKNIQKIKTCLIENEDSLLNNRLEVYVSDNGQTLPEDMFDSQNIHIYPNINLGGAAGFTRTIIESMINDKGKGFTHIILIDDDMFFSVNAVERAFIFLSVLKREYSNSMLGGAMFHADRRYFQNEAGALYDGTFKFITNCSFYDMRHEEFVIENENLKNANYQGWWFCCIPSRIINENNLPMPFFIHFDDIEYGVRNSSNELMLLNGICAFHPRFFNKNPVWITYYDVRNWLIVNSLYNITSNIQRFSSIIKKFAIYILSHRYVEVSLILKALSDFLGGFDFFKNMDCLELQKLLFSCKYIKNTPAELNLEIKEENLLKCGEKMSEILKILFIQLFTVLLPTSRKIKVVDMAKCNYFYKGRRIYAYDRENGNGILYERKPELFVKQCFSFFILLIKFAIKFPKIQREYQQRKKEIVSIDFWKKYLRLKGN